MEAPDVKKDGEKVEKSPSVRPAPQSPPSSTSSPTHDFEFTISLYPSMSLDKHQPPIYEIDLCPADDLFYQGQLLPLHHHRQLFTPHSSRPSNEDHHHEENNSNDQTKTDSEEKRNSNVQNSIRVKPKSFSFSTLRDGSKMGLRSAKEVIEKYIKMVKPFFTRRGSKSDQQQRSDQQRWNGPHSCRSFAKRRSRTLAPFSATMSQGNSGILCAMPPSNSKESSMEELQNAIQAAITHCKKSIEAKEDTKIDMPFV